MAAATPLQVELRARADADLLRFYAARAHQPLWFTRDGLLDPAARSLFRLIESSGDDGIVPEALNAAQLAQAIQGWDQEKSPAAAARAEVALSQSFAAYVRALRQAPATEMSYARNLLRPTVPTTEEALKDAASAPSLGQYIEFMRWMHPLYAPLRQALNSGQIGDQGTRQVVLNNLQRIRALPAGHGSRQVLVDVASARLWMYEDGRAVDSMRVVVGKPSHQTPMLAGSLRYAIVNPYWNIPKDLVQRNIAPNYLRGGLSYFQNGGYEVLSDWSAEAQVVDPSTIDWQAVKRGDIEVRVRQRPGGKNFMGKVKYEFPNQMGIYLHDTPEKNLLTKDVRQLSSGCIRLEDADRFGRWLFRGPLPASSDGAEQMIDVPQPVPIYVTYITAYAEGGRIALGPDPYVRDRATASAALALTTP